MIDYTHLLGRPYVRGKTDCLGLGRDFFNPLLETKIKNYARPTDFTDEHVNFFGRFFHEAGFRVIDVHPTEWRFGDVALMAIMSSVPSHCGILVEDGKLLHHFVGQTSTVEAYSGSWRNRTVGILRHKDLDFKVSETPIDIASYLPAAVQERLRDA